MNKYLADMIYAFTSAYNRTDYSNEQHGTPTETNIGKLFSVFAWGLDLAHEQADLIKLWDDLDYACGSVLDRYGANFGVARISSDDRFYRLAIRVKMMALLSGGDANTIIEASATLMDVNISEVDLEDVFPAKIALYVDSNLLTDERLELIEPIAWSIKRILAAGVGMRLYLRTYRTFRQDLSILQCCYSAVYLNAPPISQDRSSTKDWDVLQGGYVGTKFQPPIVSRDIEALTSMDIQQGSFVGANFTPPIKGRDITESHSVILSNGAVDVPIITSDNPPPVVSHKTPQNKSGGAVFHTHIKSKRID